MLLISVLAALQMLRRRITTATVASSDRLAAEYKTNGELMDQLRKHMDHEDRLGKARVDASASYAEISRRYPLYAGGAVPAIPPREFDLVALRPEYRFENAELGGTVRYLAPAERAQLEVTVRDGKLYTRYGELYDTTGGMQDSAIWVMDRNGKLYASTYYEPRKFHHSSIVAGEPVAGAGTLRVLDGQILEFTDGSGHYQPKRHHTMQVVEYLRSLGLEIDGDCLVFSTAF